MAYEYYRGHLPQDRGIKVVDVGCGDGGFLLFLKEEGFRDVWGVDIDKAQVEACKAKGVREVEAIDDLEKFLKKRQSYYGLIIMKQVIYYFSDDELIRYLTAAREALAHGGTLIIEVFNGAPLTGRYIKDKDYRIKRVFTEYSVRAVLEDSGFRVVELFGSGGAPRGLKAVLWHAAQKIWFVLVRCIYILERGLDPYNPAIFTKNLIAIATRR